VYVGNILSKSKKKYRPKQSTTETRNQKVVEVVRICFDMRSRRLRSLSHWWTRLQRRSF